MSIHFNAIFEEDLVNFFQKSMNVLGCFDCINYKLCKEFKITGCFDFRT